jgi:hypothetical protein
MLDYDTSRLERQCRGLFKSFQNRLAWTWDERFKTVLASFDVKDTDFVQAHIKKEMAYIWDDENTESAPELVQNIINYFGGFYSEQLLYTSDPDKDDILMCAWWPWGNGNTISIRIGVYAKSLNGADNDELSRVSKEWFGL